MEDKELQELLDAKRWQLENLQQQQEIASRIGRRGIAWPWWAGSAVAAAILAAVLFAPTLFVTKEELVAKAEKMEEIAAIEETEEMETIDRTETTEKAPAKATTQPIPSVEPIAVIENTPFVESHPVVETVPALPAMDSIPSTPSAPRVHTRRSTRLADVEKAPAKPKVPALIAHYINIPDSILFTSDIVINLK